MKQKNRQLINGLPRRILLMLLDCGLIVFCYYLAILLRFDRMDFGETGCCGIRITGRSPLPANTVHLMFAAADGGETERRVVEFGPQADWGEQTFTFEPVTGARQVTFLFLPGTQFDFDSFTFI